MIEANVASSVLCFRGTVSKILLIRTEPRSLVFARFFRILVGQSEQALIVGIQSPDKKAALGHNFEVR